MQDKILVFDTQNPLKKAFEVSQAWVDIMSRKEPGRYQVKSAPQVVKIPKKKVVVVGKKGFSKHEVGNDSGKIRVEDAEYALNNTVLTTTSNNIQKEIVSLKPLKVGEPSKRIKAKSKASTAD